MLRQARRRRACATAAPMRAIGVVFARHRAVAGAAGGAQLHPHRALLGDLDGIDDAAVHAHREAARFAERVLGAHELGMMIDEPARAVIAAGLLVGDAGEDEVALERDALLLEARDDERRHDRHVLHVDGAAAPHIAVVDLAAERRMGPALRLGGDDVEVRASRSGGLSPVPLSARDHVLATRASRRPASARSRPREQIGEILGGRRLVARRVRGVDAQQRLQVLDCVDRRAHVAHARMTPRRRRVINANLA